MVGLPPGRQRFISATMMSIKTLFVVVALFRAFVPPAFAHAILMESIPAVGGRPVAGNITISLRFNSLIDAERSRVTITDPHKAERVLSIRGNDAGDSLIAGTIVVVPGNYILHWQVLAIDGHITRGNVPFNAAPTYSMQGVTAQDH